MSECFGFRKKHSPRNGETEPLLPVYNDETSLQRSTHQKLHSYQQYRALSKGYMPDTDQVIANLRTFLASDVLNPSTPGLTDSGRLLTKYTKQWLREFIELLRNKNNRDQIQDLIWFLAHSKLEVDTGDLVRQAHKAKGEADVSAAYQSVKTISSLLLTNSSFRLLLSDLNRIGRQVFADTATTLSSVAQDAAHQIEPSSSTLSKPSYSDAVKNTPKDQVPPTTNDLENSATEVAEVVTDGLKETGKEALSSAQENVSSESEKDALIKHLKSAVTSLRQRPSYTDSVTTLTRIIQQYAKAYSRAAELAFEAVQEDVDTNAELDRAMRNAWALVTTFGEEKEWDTLKTRFNSVMEHGKGSDPEFETVMGELADSVQGMLTDPEFFEKGGGEGVSNVLDELKGKGKEVGSNVKQSQLRKDLDAFLQQARRTMHSVVNDRDVSKLLSTTMRLWSIVNPANKTSNTELFADSYTIFIPLLIQAIQYIPIPRLEIAVPELDLLLENLILEPGRTVNNSSFLPFRLKVETYNDLTIHKRRFRTVSTVASLVTIKVQGLSIRADEVGFWMRSHKGLMRLADEGIASFHLDERGIDIELDVEIGRERVEKILSLREVRVKIHHLNYTLRRSKLACLAWLFKPLIRPLIRKVLERQVANAIADFFHAANRELLFARERLRATRISDPKDIMTFIRAVMTRLTPQEDPDVYASVGVTGGVAKPGNVFAGRYTPSSVVKLWEEEARRAGEVVDDSASKGWRNDIFDIQAVGVEHA